MPENALASYFFRGRFLSPDSAMPSNILDTEHGGVALNDPSKGLMYQLWTLRVIGDRVALSAPNHPEKVVFKRQNRILEASLSFDQNMRPCIAFVEKAGDTEVTYLWWYDSTVESQVFTEFSECKSPRVTLDEKRSDFAGFSDVIFAYIKNNTLCIRMQRDRFGVEYPIYTPIRGRLKKIGMNTFNRLQFAVERDA